MDKLTIVDRIEVNLDGVIQVRIARLLMDGEVEVSNRWLRGVIPPTETPIQSWVDAMNAYVVDVLAWPVMDEERLALVYDASLEFHTFPVIQAYTNSRAAALAQFE